MGETLTVDTSSIADEDGMENGSFTFFWQVYDATGWNFVPFDYEGTYTIEPRDVGMTIHVIVLFEDDRGNFESVGSASTDAVAAAPAANSPAIGVPTISGTAQVGETLEADTSGVTDADGLSNVQYEYQWLADDTEVQGATNADYTLADADEGQTIKVRVSFTDGAGNQEMLTSAPTAAVAAPAQADSEDEPSELSYLTVVVTEDDSDPDNVVTTFTITWNDAEDCSASYNAYLDGVVGDPIHLGSAASEGEQIAASLTNVSAESIGFDAKLYCGTIGSGRLVDSLMIPEYSRSFDTVPISRAYLPKPGTYSTEPGLTALTVSSGTLTPAFHSQTLNYTVPDVANADGRITLTTTTKADYYTVAFIPGSLYFYSFVCSHGGQQTSVSYQDDTGNPLYPLTDADANTPGFQMELDEGENVFKIRVWPNCESGHVYKLTVTRAANAPANTPATGAPTIGGAAQVGETLTVDTSGIADADGLSGATFSYQWLSSRDTEIQGATGAAYILVPGDASKTIKVRVSFTDDEGNAEMLTSAATDAVSPAPTPNNPATGAPTISGTAQVGETLAAETSGINDDDGLDNVAYTYQWLSSRDTEIQGATDRTYTLAATDEGKAIKVRVSFTDDANNQETLTSAATAAVAAAPTPNSPATGAPTIIGTAQVGETLTANTSEVADSDGLSNVQYEYQWLADDAEISGATGSTYTVAAADEGKAIKVEVSFTDDAGDEEALTSAATDAVSAEPTPNSPATGAPTITGTAQVGEALTADTSGIADADGLENVSFSYEWLADDTAIQGATNSTYTLADADEGKTIKVRVPFTDDAGNEETLTSGEVGPVVSPQRIVVSPNCGQTVDFVVEAYDHEYVSLLLRKPNNLDITNFVLQRYEHDGAEFVSSGDVRRIEGELSSSLPSCSDLWWVDFIVEPNTLYKYTYELKDDSGSIVIETSLTVRTPPIPDSTGVADATLSDLTLSGIDFVPTLAAFYFVGPFLSDTVSYVGEAANSVTQTRVSPTLGHAGAGYVIMVDGVPDVDGVVPLSLGSSMVTVEVTAEDDTTTRTYTITVTRTANTPATGAPTISGTAQVGETLTADTSGVADADGLSNVQYEYQWLADDVDISGATSSTYTLTDSEEGKAIKVEVSFTDDAGNDESLTSAATEAVTAAPAPNNPATGAPTISGTAQVGETLTANTSGVADADGLSNVEYEYQWLADDAEVVGATGSTYTLADVEKAAIKVEVNFGRCGHLHAAGSGSAHAQQSTKARPDGGNVNEVDQRHSFHDDDQRHLHPAAEDEGNEVTFTETGNGDQRGHGCGGCGTLGAAVQAQGPRSHVNPRLCDPHLGRPPGREHHRLRDPAARPRERSRGRLQCIGGEHGQRRHHLHRQRGGCRHHLHLPDQGHQRGRNE